MSCPVEISKISSTSSREMSERNGDVNSVIKYIGSESTKILFKTNLNVFACKKKPKIFEKSGHSIIIQKFKIFGFYKIL